MAKLDRDKLFQTNRAVAANGAQAALHPIQELPPHEQLAAVSVLFHVLCMHTGVAAREAHDLGEKLIRPEPFHRTANIQIEALQDFAGYNHPTTR